VYFFFVVGVDGEEEEEAEEEAEGLEVEVGEDCGFLRASNSSINSAAFIWEIGSQLLCRSVNPSHLIRYSFCPLRMRESMMSSISQTSSSDVIVGCEELEEEVDVDCDDDDDDEEVLSDLRCD